MIPNRIERLLFFCFCFAWLSDRGLYLLLFPFILGLLSLINVFPLFFLFFSGYIYILEDLSFIEAFIRQQNRETLYCEIEVLFWLL